MIKFIHTADLHLGIQKYGKINSNTGINTRIEEDFKQFDRVVNYAIEKKVNLFLIAGDVFDKRKPDDIVKKEFAKRLKILIQSKIITVVLIGNHEGVTAKDTAHCLSAEKILTDKKYLHIVDDARVIELENILIACLPYYNDKILTGFFLKKGVDAILLGHALIKGAKQNGYIFTKGMHPLSFKHKQFVYMGYGHIHEHQSIGKAVYSGGINRINFSDEGIKKGFMYGIIANHQISSKFITLDSRRFLSINEEWQSGIKKIIDKYDIFKTIVKLNLTDKTGVSVIPVSRIKSYLIKRGAIVDSVNIIRENKVKIRDRKYKNISPQKALERYLKGEKDSVIKKGIEILDKVV